MNKEEILAKSRLEQKDEGMLQAENEGQYIGILAFNIIFIIIIILNLLTGHHNYSAMAMFWAFVSAESYPKYKFTKKNMYLFFTIISAIACILFLLCFLIDLFW